MPIIGSYHAPILLHTCNSRIHGNPCLLKFEAKWLIDPAFLNLVKNVWSFYMNGSNSYH